VSNFWNAGDAVFLFYMVWEKAKKARSRALRSLSTTPPFENSVQTIYSNNMNTAHPNKAPKGQTTNRIKRLNKRRAFRPSLLNPEDQEQYELAFRIMSVF
jgi:hypothetical protein